MKKILSLLSAVTLGISVVTPVAACNNKNSSGLDKGIQSKPDEPPVTYDIKYYQDLYDITKVKYDNKKQNIDELKAQAMIAQICGGGVLICDELQKMIDVAKVELYQYNVILSDCQYQIFSLQYNGNFIEPTIKVKALGFLTDKLTTLSTIKAIMLLYPTNYRQNDIAKINTQIVIVQKLIMNLSN
ncbi:hypothetical protein [Spiroplasma sp. SV19]|uniref:hypothetical protein n=1 Tax=Spiroplasma sp. SV19 TaxID=2570468 RepID=UPI0024B68E20|nr:hypothetical protein [Spiroplasma sp. SV19]WHQ37058.1 hypothetical protein E7Y35_04070 [Spiroplasma sp. SV19]